VLVTMVMGNAQGRGGLAGARSIPLAPGQHALEVPGPLLRPGHHALQEHLRGALALRRLGWG
jgi:hypothetical protein